MNTIFVLVTLQALLGAFDGIFHHEITEKLCSNVRARSELLLHSLRSGIYALVFVSLAGLEWHGFLAYGFLLLLVVELTITLIDFVIEDRIRDLPASERITHTILTLNYGAILALLVPIVYSWSQQDTGWFQVNHGLFTGVFILFAIGVSLMSLREFYLYKSLLRKIPHNSAKGRLSEAPLRFLITGATGFIGQHLTQRLLEYNHQVVVLARDYRKVIRLFGSQHRLTIIHSIDQLRDNDHFDVIINLAGEPLAGGTWNRKRKMTILQSRIALTSQLVNYMRDCRNKPNVFISGSAIGYYGSQQDSILNETSQCVDSFSSQLCRQWESVANGAQEFGIRTCLLRTGLVLGSGGGMLGSLLFPFWYGLGGKLGDGHQWMSWISIDDLLNIIEHIVENSDLSGPINATAPNPVTNAFFTQTLASVMHRPALFSLPQFLLRRLLGQAADELFLSSARVLPEKLLRSGFQFNYPDLNATLKGILAK